MRNAIASLLEGEGLILSNSLDYFISRAQERMRWDVVSGGNDGEQVNFIFSPSPKLFFLRSLNLRGTTVHLTDIASQYFIGDPIATAHLLNSFIHNETKTIVTVGSSKGGFGALLYAAIIARKHTSRMIEARVCSPQVTLWPFNPELTYPSYHQLIKAAEADSQLQLNLERYGFPVKLVRTLRNIRIFAAYGLRNRVDSRECGALSGIRSVTTFGLPIKSHLSLLPFCIDISRRDLVESALLRYFVRNSGDTDAEAIRISESLQNSIDEFCAIDSQLYDLGAFWRGLTNV